LIPLPFFVKALKTLPASVTLRVAFYCTLIGLPWELIAVKVLKIWSFNPNSTTLWIGNFMPVEELLFYPLVGIAVVGFVWKQVFSAQLRQQKKASSANLGSVQSRTKATAV